jgi:hypothetical protein
MLKNTVLLGSSSFQIKFFLNLSEDFPITYKNKKKPFQIKAYSENCFEKMLFERKEILI